MRTIYLVTLSVLALMLAMCAGCDDSEEGAPNVRCKVVSVTFKDTAAGYVYTLDMRQTFAGMDGLAQEVEIVNDIGGSHTFIEFTRRTGDWHIDRHIGVEGGTRSMVLYAANVDNAGQSAPLVLAANDDGSFITAMPFTFLNAPDGVQGTVTKRDDSRAIRWSIECLPDGVRVTIDGKVTFYAKG